MSTLRHVQLRICGTPGDRLPPLQMHGAVRKLEINLKCQLNMAYASARHAPHALPVQHERVADSYSATVFPV